MFFGSHSLNSFVMPTVLATVSDDLKRDIKSDAKELKDTFDRNLRSKLREIKDSSTVFNEIFQVLNQQVTFSREENNVLREENAKLWTHSDKLKENSSRNLRT